MNMFEILTSVYGGVALGEPRATYPHPRDRRQTVGAAGAAVRGAGRRWLGAVARELVAAFHERAVARELSRLDDRTLRDIGLSRSEIAYVARTFAQSYPSNENVRKLAA